MREKKVPAHLAGIGEKIKEGWEKAAKKHGLKITIQGISPLPKFSFGYENSAELSTLFTQEMLERGFLAKNSVYVSYAHSATHIKNYFEAVDEVFDILKEGIDRQGITKMLKGPAARSGFARLA